MLAREFGRSKLELIKPNAKSTQPCTASRKPDRLVFCISPCAVAAKLKVALAATPIPNSSFNPSVIIIKYFVAGCNGSNGLILNVVLLDGTSSV